jgi:hypothetical protein
MTLGWRDRSAREKARALKSRIVKEKKVADAPKLAARALAISAIRETFAVDRPITAIRNESVATCESAYTIPRANEPEPMMTTSAVFTKARPLELAYFPDFTIGSPELACAAKLRRLLSVTERRRPQGHYREGLSKHATRALNSTQLFFRDTTASASWLAAGSSCLTGGVRKRGGIAMLNVIT